MRVAFTGKGGSGKTTLASLFAEQMAADGRCVLALDADINQHLASALGYYGELRSMGTHLSEIKQYLAGTNPRFTSSSMHKTTPPGSGSNFVQLMRDDWFIQAFTEQSRGVYLAGAGDIPDGNVGVKCYHGLNGAVELVLGHMLDRPKDVVIVDMTAGADAFSSSIFVKVDALVLVVEPTLKSLSVYDQFAPRAKEYDMPLVVVANKVHDDEDLAFIKTRVSNVAIVVETSSFVRKRERGDKLDIETLDDGVVDALRQLDEVLQCYGRDWDALQERAYRLHQKNAQSWMGTEVAQHIDKSFSLRATYEQRL